jgi:hypothetical protein
MQRVGFLQIKILPIFGFYPWRCPECKTRFLLRTRGTKRKKMAAATTRRDPDTGGPLNESLNASMPDKGGQFV